MAPALQATAAFILASARNVELGRSYVQALLCADRCGRCETCRKLAGGTHPDVRWIAPDGKNIRIEQVRELQRQALYPPHEGTRKVLVIDGADRLSREASNSLLKTLEDPPPHAVFLLLTQRLGDLLPTVVSRCRVVRDASVTWDGDDTAALCWHAPYWLDRFPIEANEVGAPEATPAGIAEGLKTAEGLRGLQAGTRALYDALPDWSAADALAASAGLAKLPRERLEYALHGLTARFREHAFARGGLDALRALSVSYGHLRANANPQLLLDALLLQLQAALRDGA